MELVRVNNKIKVSVIMGVYNGAHCVKKAIDSILCQTFNNWELIICNDGSTDNTAEILSLYGNDARVKIITNDKNFGLAVSLNKCIEQAEGEYLIRQDADDVSTPNRFELLYNKISSDDSISVVSSSAYLVDDEYKPWGHITLTDPLDKNWVRGSQIIHASSIMRKSSIVAIGCYNPLAIRVEDYNLWVRLTANRYKIVTLEDRLYSIHWLATDYKRRKRKYRFNEFKVSLFAYLNTDCPWYYFPYVLKPLFMACFPHRIVQLLHTKKFKLEDSQT